MMVQDKVKFAGENNLSEKIYLEYTKEQVLKVVKFCSSFYRNPLMNISTAAKGLILASIVYSKMEKEEKEKYILSCGIDVNNSTTIQNAQSFINSKGKKMNLLNLSREIVNVVGTVSPQAKTTNLKEFSEVVKEQYTKELFFEYKEKGVLLDKSTIHHLLEDGLLK